MKQNKGKIMAVERKSAHLSDHQTSIEFRNIESIDARIASLASKTIAHQDSAELAKLNDYRVTVMSFNSQLEAWCDAEPGTQLLTSVKRRRVEKHEGRLEACRAILSCYANGGKNLSLKGLGLTSLPESMSHLKELEQLDLSGNNFNKRLDMLSSLPNLHRIEIDENQRNLCPKDILTTQSAEMLFNQFSKLSLEELNTLRQTSKYLKSSIDNYLKQASKNSKFTWIAPENFDISKIQKPPTTLSRHIIDLDLSNVKGLTPEGLGDFLRFFPDITKIKLPVNTTNEHLALLASSVQLQHLDLNDCYLITDTGLANLASLSQLQRLNLKECDQITDAGLANLASLSQLQRLNLKECDQITDAGLANLASFAQLQYLNLKGCDQITDAGLAGLASLSQLQHLDLSWCSLITDAGLAPLASLIQLQHLDLTVCDQITDAGLANLASLKQLRYLNLNWCGHITDAGLTHLSSLIQLQHLDLGWCRHITDEGLALLAPLTQLQYLNLQKCKRITGEGLALLAPLTQLQYLNLQKCKRVTDLAKQAFRTNHPSCLLSG